MDTALVRDLKNIIDPAVQPCYCSVVLQRAREVTIEGWLLQTDDPLYVIIQPSVVFDPDKAKLAFHFEDVISITPTYPPEPYRAQVAALGDEPADYEIQRQPFGEVKINREAFFRA